MNIQKFNVMFATLALVSCSTAPNGGGGGGGGDTGVNLPPGFAIPVKEFVKIVSPANRDLGLDTFTTALSTHLTPAGGEHTGAFRIPGTLKLRDGRIFLTADNRHGFTADNPHDIDIVGRISSDPTAKIFEPMMELDRFDDYAYTNSARGFSSESCSFIDSAIGQATNGDLITLSITSPWGVGFANGGGQTRKIHLTDAFEKKGSDVYLKLQAGFNKGSSSYSAQDDSDTAYVYRVKVSGTYPSPILNSDLTPAGGAYEGMQINENWYLLNKDGSLHTNKQRATKTAYVSPDKYVNTHIFYKDSPLWTVPSFFVTMHRSKDMGKNWGKMIDITWQYEGRDGKLSGLGFAGISPGNITTIFTGKYKGRMINAFQTSPGSEYNISLYSDDDGKTWRLGENQVLPTTYRTSESVIVEAPEDQLIMFCRVANGNHPADPTGGVVVSSTSKDGGITWPSPILVPLPHRPNGGTMMGAIRLWGTVSFGRAMVAVTGTQRSGASRRINGEVNLGFLEKGADGFYRPVFPGPEGKWKINTHLTAEATGNKDFWTHVNPNEDGTPGGQDFGYSSLVELANGNIAVHYEPFHDGSVTSKLVWKEIEIQRK